MMIQFVLLFSFQPLWALAQTIQSGATVGVECAPFGGYGCDASGTLLQCAYVSSQALTWYSMGAPCSILAGVNDSDLDPVSEPAITSVDATNVASPSAQSAGTLPTTEIVAFTPVPVTPTALTASGTPEPTPAPQSSADIDVMTSTTTVYIPILPPTDVDVTPPPVATSSVAPAPVPAPQPTSSSGSGNVLISGKGDGTYYYDFTGNTCNNEPAYQENHGYTSCEPSAPPYRTLAEHQDNFIVALALDQMNANKAVLCGKRVKIYRNGQPVLGNFVVWDSCAACTGGVRLDFSVSALMSIDSRACELGVVPNISWEVVDEQVIPYVA
ncbi:hypothetical protein BC830DRAFT_1216788 [Chytriomyces sp. MP71]|nr:hypothetical protein BC830DRAFT_1216788 [Chytriomyces sp. MP71]